MASSVYLGPTVGGGGGNPFDQNLNTSDDVTFNAVSIPGWTWDTDALTSEQVMQPTFAEVLENHPEIAPTWAALSDLSYSDDCVVLVNGGGKAFITEYFSGDLTGASTPDWASAPNAGDTVSDGDITWIATAKTWATALATTPTTWTANHDYSPDVSSPVLIWPTSPNGHLYLAYPLPLTSDSSEPTFGTTFGDYTADNDGYWMDAGSAAGKSITTDDITVRDTLSVSSLSDVDSVTSAIVEGVRTLQFVATSGAASEDFNEYIWSFDATIGASAVSMDQPGLMVLGATLGVPTTALFSLVSGSALDASLTDYFGFVEYGNNNSVAPTTYTSSYFRTPKAATTYYGQYFIPFAAATFTTAYDIYAKDLAGSGTNLYYLWFDSQGVFRVREDSTFNSVGQAIATLYNPQFTKYTAGAANFERVILGQWNSNVAEIGNEKGGTGTLRDLRFIGQDIKPNPTGYFYLHEAVVTAAPAAGDCDAAGETNRVVYDSTNDNLYVCSGASGWRKIATAAP